MLAYSDISGARLNMFQAKIAVERGSHPESAQGSCAGLQSTITTRPPVAPNHYAAYYSTSARLL
jgi:hypothetical protein